VTTLSSRLLIVNVLDGIASRNEPVVQMLPDLLHHENDV
jgi:hypothetical protein